MWIYIYVYHLHIQYTSMLYVSIGMGTNTHHHPQTAPLNDLTVESMSNRQHFMPIYGYLTVNYYQPVSIRLFNH